MKVTKQPSNINIATIKQSSDINVATIFTSIHLGTLTSIETLALKSVLPKDISENAFDAIVALCANTETPSIAVEMLCGLYKRPGLPKFSVNSNDVLMKIINLDPFKQKVSYEFIEQNTISGYYYKDFKKEDITLELLKAYREDKSEEKTATWYSNIPTGKYFRSTGTCPAEDWIEYGRRTNQETASEVWKEFLTLLYFSNEPKKV